MRAAASALSESLANPGQQLHNFAQTLQEVSYYWPSARSVALGWDANRSVLATDNALATYRAIYGNDLVRGLRYFGATARRYSQLKFYDNNHERFLFDAPLPKDAVVIPQRSYPKGIPYVLTVVSALEQCVVKIFCHERKSRFENELNAWRLAQIAGIDHRVPEVISSGESASGFCWVVTRLVRNNMFNPPLIGERLWRRYLLAKILPELHRFYVHAGIDTSPCSILLDSVRAELPGHPLSATLRKLSDLVDAARQTAIEDRVPLTLVHGDLRPHNVHRYSGRWWLIDWSMSRRAPLMVDLWPKPSLALSNGVFCAWLRGQIRLDEVPRFIRAPLNLYAEWLASSLAIKLDANGLRFHALATLLHQLSYRYWPVTQNSSFIKLLESKDG